MLTEMQQQLFSLQDEFYRAFHARLIPTVAPARVIGVRVPQLRRLAATLSGTDAAQAFLRALPHDYYEENNLHAFLIERIRSYPAAMAETEVFLPYLDNWATCDSFAPRIFAAHPAEVYDHVLRWLRSTHVYTVRYGIVTLMRLYLFAQFDPAQLQLVAALPARDYYVTMAAAWYFATALCKQYPAAIVYFEQRLLPPAVHAKAIQKATESRCLDSAVKTYLRQLK